MCKEVLRKQITNCSTKPSDWHLSVHSMIPSTCLHARHSQSTRGKIVSKIKVTKILRLTPNAL